MLLKCRMNFLHLFLNTKHLSIMHIKRKNLFSYRYFCINNFKENQEYNIKAYLNEGNSARG